VGSITLERKNPTLKTGEYLNTKMVSERKNC